MNDWTETDDGYVTEASTLGIPPGQAPTLWGVEWNPEFHNGELIGWFRYHDTTRWTIIND